MTRWAAHEIEVLKTLTAEGLSFAQIAKVMGRTRSGVAGGVRRHVHGLSSSGKRKRRPWGASPSAHIWSENALTEPYAMRKLRRQMQ